MRQPKGYTPWPRGAKVFVTEHSPTFAGTPLGPLQGRGFGVSGYVRSYDSSDHSYDVEFPAWEEGGSDWTTWIDAVCLSDQDPMPPPSEDEIAELYQMLGIEAKPRGRTKPRIQDETTAEFRKRCLSWKVWWEAHDTLCETNELCVVHSNPYADKEVVSGTG